MKIYMHSEEMPQKCVQCPCFHAATPMSCHAVMPSKEKQIVAPYGPDRPDWCPLVEMVEWKDRTINASDLIQWIVEHDENFYKGSAKAIIDHIFELLESLDEG